ncbi:hypothetical protein D3C87_1488040 [compost metagenome]
MICRDLSLKRVGKRAPLFFQIDNDLFAGFQDDQRAGRSARFQIVISRVSTRRVSLEAHCAELEFGTGRHIHGYRNRLGMVECRIRGELVDIGSGDRYVDDTAVSGFFVKNGHQAVPVFARLDDDAEITGNRLFVVIHKCGGRFQPVSQVAVRVACFDRCFITNRIDDFDGFLVAAEQRDAEYLECVCLRRKDGRKSQATSQQAGQASPPAAPVAHPPSFSLFHTQT